MTIGIYKIENLINHKCYIGQSVNIEKRWVKHKAVYCAPNDRGYNYPLYKAIRKYGIDNFNFSIVEECSQENLNKKEVYWIEFYNAFFNGYNQTLGGDNSSIINKESILGVIQDLESTDLIHQEIADKWHVSREMVQGINTGRYWHHNRDYPIQQRTKDRLQKIQQNKENRCIDCGKVIYKTSIRCNNCENLRRKQENVLPLTREELKEKIKNQSFVSIGKEFNISDNGIRRWCEHYNLPTRKRDIKAYSEEEWAEI